MINSNSRSSNSICVNGTCSESEIAQFSSVEIGQSVGRLGRNSPPDVESIQDALNRISIHQGGANPRLRVDSLNGPKTETAIYQFQVQQLDATRADARVDPDRSTIQSMNALLNNTDSTAGSGVSYHSNSNYASSLSDRDKAIMDRVYSAVTIAMNWTVTASHALESTMAYLNGDKLFEDHYKLVDRCFKISTVSDDLEVKKAILKIKKIFELMRRARMTVDPLLIKQTRGCNPPGKTNFATAQNGGFYLKEPVEEMSIRICTHNISDSRSTEWMADLLVHEFAHFVGPLKGQVGAIGHGGRAKDMYGLDAFTLNHKECMISASNYAWLAWLSRLPKDQWLTNNG